MIGKGELKRMALGVPKMSSAVLIGRHFSLRRPCDVGWMSHPPHVSVVSCACSDALPPVEMNLNTASPVIAGRFAVTAVQCGRCGTIHWRSVIRG